MNILGMAGNVVDVYQPSNGLEPVECSRIERYLNATRSTLLFAKGVILVEGDAELILIPALIKSVFGISLDELGISLVSMDSAFFEHLSKLFHHDRIRKRCAIITDLDEPYIKLPDDPSADNDFEKGCRNSQVAGQQRKSLLDEHIKGNKFVNVFYAPHTFEVNFIAADNSLEAIATLPNIYTDEAYIKKSSKRLKLNDLAVSGKEILRLANKAGKGWFALLMSEVISSETIIPDYILKAVAFACQNELAEAILMKMCVHRLNNGMPYVNKEDRPVQFFKDNASSISDCINEFLRSCVDDELSDFIGHLDR